MSNSFGIQENLLKSRVVGHRKRCAAKINTIPAIKGRASTRQQGRIAIRRDEAQRTPPSQDRACGCVLSVKRNEPDPSGQGAYK
jgi:hypothetical protein